MKAKLLNLTSITIALVLLGSLAAHAQTVTYSENFTGGSTNNSWYYFNGACLTAGTTAATVVNVPGSASAVAGVIPSCVSMLTGSFYYNSGNAAGEPLVGGANGTIPGTDPTVGGALRFTNVPTNGSYPQGFQESGAILSNFSFPLSSQGIQVTFVTETYEGDSGGGDGADGISFFLQDASAAPDLGATGGSLAYTCTNVNNDNTHFRTSGRARGYDGLAGAYVGVGIDEYGNFLNGSNSVNGIAPTSNGDNTASGASNLPGGGANFQGNRIGIRGAGYVTWGWLNANYPTYYPTSFTNAQASAAVQATCATGYVQNYSATSGTFSPAVPLIAVPDYPALAYSNVPSVSIANESAIYRGNGTSSQLTSQYGVPISYTLKITTAGLLTLSYSYDGGAAIPVISGYNITANNGALPANVRFGFAGSDGGATNIHEVMCFQAAPQTTSQSSASGNQKQSAPVVTGTQVYFSYYDPTTWAGSVASDSLLVDSSNNVVISSTANWDASCVLTGILTGATCQKTGVAGPTTAPTPASRVALTWNYSPTTGSAAGIPFAWSSLSAVEQTAIDAGDPNTPTGTPAGTTYQPYRVSYLLGDRGNEQNASGTGEYSTGSASTNYPPFRARASVLGDIIDSSPTWVGPPISGYPNAWTDKYDGGTMLENSGQTYGAFTTQEMSRTNVVYAGANDGFLHGFRSGYYDSSGNYVGTGTGSSFVGTQNDGAELLAYMPGYVLSHIQTTSSVTTVNGSTTTIATTPNSATNYSDPQYGHQFDVDATPGTGDVFYNGTWHTILVGGLGAGGADIFALDITNPENSSITTDPTFSTTPFSTTGTSSGSTTNLANTAVVIGDWSTITTTTTTNTLTSCTTTRGIQHCTTTPSTSTATTSTLTCTHTTGSGSATNCGMNLGNTYGTPQIRRFHNGQWGAVFGNGFGSSTGDAGIYVMLLDTSTGAPTFYYLSAGKSGTSDGIGYVSTADLDGDHITDYVYAGDLLGNIWRFDLTSTDPTHWAVTSIPVYTTASGQPITSKLSIISVLSTPARRVIVAFGTGREFPLSITGAASYLTTQQSLYGIWDWNLATWNSHSTTQYAILPYGGVAAPTSGLTAGSVTPSNLQAQSMTTYTIGGLDYRSVTSNAVCWAGTTGCTTGQYGWYLPLTYGYANPADVNLPLSSSTNPPVYEQVIYNPILVGDTFIVNTVIPSAASLINCFSVSAGGFTMAIDPGSGGSFAKPVITPPATVTIPTSDPTNYNGVGVGGTGTGFVVTTNPACTGSSCTSCTGSGCAPPCTGPTCAAPPACTPGTNNFIVTQTVTGTPTTVKFNPQCNTVGSRQTWIQRR